MGCDYTLRSTLFFLHCSEEEASPLLVELEPCFYKVDLFSPLYCPAPAVVRDVKVCLLLLLFFLFLLFVFVCFKIFFLLLLHLFYSREINLVVFLLFFSHLLCFNLPPPPLS